MKKLSLILVLVMILNVFSCVSVAAADVSDFARATASTNRTVHLTGISNATSGIYVKWNAIKGATGYRVYRRGAGQTTWTYLTTTKNVYYIDGKVASGNYYRYTIRATFSNGYGGYESGLYIKRLVNPYSIKAANDATGVKVTWGKVNGADSYNVYRRAAGEASWSRVATVKTTSFIDANVKNGTYYKYTVRAVSGKTLSYFYDGSLVKYVAAPKASVVLTPGATSVTVYWNAISGATGYRVYRRGAGESIWTYLATVSTTIYVDTEVTPDNYYRYTVRAQAGNYTSGYFTNGPVIKFIGIVEDEPTDNPNDNPGDNPADEPEEEKPLTGEQILNIYKTAVLDVKNNGSAGYTKKNWQELNYVNMTVNASLQDTMRSLLESFLTSEADAVETVYEKGSEDAKSVFPGCGAKLSEIESITCDESGINYVIEIKMKSQANPGKTDTSGIGSMSNDIVYEEDIREAMSSVPMASFKRCDINYNSLVIKAVISKDGKLISLDQTADMSMSVIVNMSMMGEVAGNIAMNMCSKYYDFAY